MVERRKIENAHIRQMIDTINALRVINPSLDDKAKNTIIEALKSVATRTDAMLKSAQESIDSYKS